MITPIEPRGDLVDEVYQRLKDAILFGDLPEGVALVQADLVDQLGVSRQPISHALTRLRQDGLVVERGRRGLMVTPVDPDRLLSLFQVRAALDALAARLAAERVADRVIHSKDLMKLDRIMEQGWKAVRQNAVRELIEADVAFHRAVYDVSGNPAIDEMARTAWPHFQRSMGLVLSVKENREISWREHRDILASIAAGDPPMAEKRARDHAERAGRATSDRLKARDDAA
jgi:DNA-binding GntR family transcriptional regulator